VSTIKRLTLQPFHHCLDFFLSTLTTSMASVQEQSHLDRERQRQRNLEKIASLTAEFTSPMPKPPTRAVRRSTLALPGQAAPSAPPPLKRSSTTDHLPSLQSLQSPPARQRAGPSKSDSLVEEAPHHDIAMTRLGLTMPPEFKDRVAVIIPSQLYLSDMTAALNPTLLKLLGVSHIINATNRHVPNQFADRGVAYLNVDIEDEESAPLGDFFQQCFRFIDDALTQPNRRVLVHCMCGISRSSSLIMAYLLHHYKGQRSLKHIHRDVKKRRPQIAPNIGFAQALLALELSLRGHNSMSLSDLANSKRTISPATRTQLLTSLDRLASPHSSTCDIL
jgi:protein-tyrosine phosphatase